MGTLRRVPDSLRVLLVLAAVIGLAVTLVWATLPRGSSPEPPPTLADFWSGHARWTLERVWTSADLGQPAAYSGARMEVAGGTWYLFNRQTFAGGCGAGGEGMGIQVRRSTDRGRSWSAPVTAVAPTPGTEWACLATDGDAVYDPGRRRWRLLFQCRNANGGWNGCYAERAGADPMGPFAASPAQPNPVIRSGDLWGAICDPADDCARLAGGPGKVREEGTFDVFRFDGRRYWVGFHGYDGRRGYRGIARTASFARGSFEVDGAAPGLPPDTVLDADDGRGFRETWAPGGPIGAGLGSIAEEGGFTYQLAEVADRDLACTPGQNWDLGLFRTRSTASTRWEPYPAGNPIVYSSRAGEDGGPPRGCNAPYGSLFRDPTTGVRYLMHGRHTGDPAHDGIYLYRLQWDRNLLVNGDFWRADAEGWVNFPTGPTARAVYRDPNGSPDGTPWLSLNCGAPACQAGQGLFQDARRPAGVDAVAFGATLRTEAGAGRVDVMLRQLDGAGRVLTQDTIEVSATPRYEVVRKTVALEGATRTLRLQLDLRSPATFRADNLFVQPAG